MNNDTIKTTDVHVAYIYLLFSAACDIQGDTNPACDTK